jgi:glycopeptide antibiotics resistance protein
LFFSRSFGSTLYCQPVALKIDFPKNFFMFIIIGFESQQCNTTFRKIHIRKDQIKINLDVLLMIKIVQYHLYSSCKDHIESAQFMIFNIILVI